MELIIAGGVGEHGRNAFLVGGREVTFLVDCGKMAGMPQEPYPRLTEDQIGRMDAVFLTHSHGDHTGALPWLFKKGFSGRVIASRETLTQLPFPVKRPLALEGLCPVGKGHFQKLKLTWGRTGHCAGSVWYRFEEGDRAILFSGDYIEETKVYACDPIRGQTADLAILDCAYGPDDRPYALSCDRLIQGTECLLSKHALLLFPVPKYGRGLEILALFSAGRGQVSCFGDDLFLENLAKQREGGFWYKPAQICRSVMPYNGEGEGIVFVSDPQLKSPCARKIADHILSLGGIGVMTGTLEEGSFSKELVNRGLMEEWRYPVHQNLRQYERLVGQNHFSRAIPYHSEAITSEQKIEF